VVHQNPPHELRRDAYELSPILPIGPILASQSHERFVDQSGGLKGMAGAFVAHLIPGEASQFAVHQRDQVG
jgi:hypothetical protein